MESETYRENYPRDGAGRFVPKTKIAEASRDPEAMSALRVSLQEERERVKLDALVSAVRAGGLVHHPDENKNLAVDKSGEIADGRWANYARLLEEYECCAKECLEQRERVDLAAQEVASTSALRIELPLRKINVYAVSEKTTKAAAKDLLKKYMDHCNGLQNIMEGVGVSPTEMRKIGGMIALGASKVDRRVDNFLAMIRDFQNAEEAVHKSSREKPERPTESVNTEEYETFVAAWEMDTEAWTRSHDALNDTLRFEQRRLRESLQSIIEEVRWCCDELTSVCSGALECVHKEIDAKELCNLEPCEPEPDAVDMSAQLYQDVGNVVAEAYHAHR